MKTSRVFFLVGMVLYIGSFFLTAARDARAAASDTGYPGYFCAYITLITPWGHDGLNSLRESPGDYFSVLFSGWINPVFLITVLLLLLKPAGRLGPILRIVLLLMFTACWIVFYKMHIYPREGYFLWTAAMLLAMFAARGASRAGKAGPAAVQKAVDNRSGIS